MSDKETLEKEIAAQGNAVRIAKTEKKDVSVIKAEVAKLLALKQKLSEVTGEPIPSGGQGKSKKGKKKGSTKNSKKADSQPATQNTQPATASSKGGSIEDQIAEQANKVRKLKGKKADKAVVKAEVDKLLALKAQQSGSAPAPAASKGGSIEDQITEQANKVRKLKGEKADKAVIKAEVDRLLALKAQSGGISAPAKGKKSDKKQQLVKEHKKPAKDNKKSAPPAKKVQQTNLTQDVSWAPHIGIGHAQQEIPANDDTSWTPITPIGHSVYSWQEGDAVPTAGSTNSAPVTGNCAVFAQRAADAEKRIKEMSAALDLCMKHGKTDSAELKKLKEENLALTVENHRLRQGLAAKIGSSHSHSSSKASSSKASSSKPSSSTKSSTKSSKPSSLPVVKSKQEWVSKVQAAGDVFIDRYVLGTKEPGFPGSLWITKATEKLSKCSDQEVAGFSKGTPCDVEAGVARAMKYIFANFKF